MFRIAFSLTVFLLSLPVASHAMSDADLPKSFRSVVIEPMLDGQESGGYRFMITEFKGQQVMVADTLNRKPLKIGAKVSVKAIPVIVFENGVEATKLMYMTNRSIPRERSSAFGTASDYLGRSSGGGGGSCCGTGSYGCH